ncbi:MAG: carbon-nitrogen hydrolase family protein [Opitutaceae bacterium]|nr:carbon-nitrogen hydrolase family protein [Opitutaceae bacterium]
MNSPKPGSFKLALAQMLVAGGEMDANLQRAVRLIAAAAEGAAQVVLLPEALDLGWTSPSGRKLAEPIPEGRVCQTLRAAARRHGVYVCAGLTERAGELVFNAAVLIAPAGEVLLHHRKLNELEIGHDVYDQGDRLAVAHTPLATFGLMICADGYVRGQFVTRTLGLMGADVILSPSAWAVPPGHDNVKEPYGAGWRENYGVVAKDFRLWIAGCSNVGRIKGGPWDGHSCIGCSLVVDPQGRPALMGPYGEQAEKLLMIEVKPEARPTRGRGWESLWKKQAEAAAATPSKSTVS